MRKHRQQVRNASRNIWKSGFGIELSLALLLLALPRNTLAQLSPCGPEELKAALPSDDPSYHDAVSLSKTLSRHGIGVKCILRSTMENTFDGQEGAAVYRTDHGSFEVCFLPENGTFERLKVTEERKGRQRYLYRFTGPPQPWPTNLIDSAFPIYFVPSFLAIIMHEYSPDDRGLQGAFKARNFRSAPLISSPIRIPRNSKTGRVIRAGG